MIRVAVVVLTVGLTLLAAALAGLLPADAAAADLTVTTCADADPGSLRETIATANVGDTIHVPSCTVALTSGPLTITKSLTVRGAGVGLTRIDGGGAVRVFSIGTSDGPPITVTLAGLAVRNGYGGGRGAGS